MAFTQVDQWTGPIATVQAVAPMGKITGVLVWWTGQTIWVPVPTSGIPVGAAISVSVGFRNDSSYTVKSQVIAYLITPSGQRVALSMASPTPQLAIVAANLPPQGTTSVESLQVVLSAAGAYSLEARLNLEAA